MREHSDLQDADEILDDEGARGHVESRDMKSAFERRRGN
jgi:hypothetical protein